MKKEKHLVSKVGKGGFSFRGKDPTIEEIFEGYPPFSPPFSDDEENINPEEDAVLIFEHILSILLYSDSHPPKINTIYGRNIYFCICFESREQKNDFLHKSDLYRLGNKYLAAEDFAEAFGINIETGKKDLSQKKSGMVFGKTSMSFGNSSLSFQSTKKKKELSEKLKELRANEKDLAKLMEWRADPEYWLCLAFASEKHKQNLLTALGLELEFGGKYIWCHDVAKVLDVELLPCPYPNKNVYQGKETKLEAIVGEDF